MRLSFGCLVLFALLGSMPLISRGQGFFKKHTLLFSESLKKKPKFFAGFDSRHSFISRRQVNIGGVRLGLTYDQRVRFSFGLYFLVTPFFRNQILSNGDTITSKLGFAYFAGACEYVFFKSKRWEISVPFYTGIGGTSLSRRDSTKGLIIPLESSVNAVYKIWPWLGLGWGVGYRFMLVNNKKVPENFNNPIYVLGIRLYFGEIYRAVLKKKKPEDQPIPLQLPPAG